MNRSDGRLHHELRPVTVVPHYLDYAEGSVLISFDKTRVLCAASVEEKVPPHVKGTGQGWITAEYSLLPRSTHQRTVREVTRGRVGGRTHEIQRLIGRALRSVIDLSRLGERTIWVDCDVLQADGGTRTAAITGGFVAVVLALGVLQRKNTLPVLPVIDFLAAISVGKVGTELMLDLSYEEDSRAEVDMNVVMTGQGRFVELQGTAEGAPFSYDELQEMLFLAKNGIELLVDQQKAVFREVLGAGEPWRC